MPNYIGLDVSMKETNICVVDERGNILHESRVLSNPDRIAEHLFALEMSIEKISIESGSISRWLVSHLQALGLPVICIDARHVSAILSTTVNKTDRNDAFGLANATRCGMVKEVYLKTEASTDVSVLIGSRSTLVKQRTQMKNTIRGLLKNYGILIRNCGKKSFTTLAKEAVEDLSILSQMGLTALIGSYEYLGQAIDDISKQIGICAAEDKEASLLMSIPGVGPMTALSFKAALGDPKRFEDSRDLGAYFGLTPRQYASGEICRQGKISKCGSREMRSLLYESASVMLTRTKAWSKPKAWALKIQRKKGHKKAAIALARKLCEIMHQMLLTGKDFEYGQKAA